MKRSQNRSLHAKKSPATANSFPTSTCLLTLQTRVFYKLSLDVQGTSRSIYAKESPATAYRLPTSIVKTSKNGVLQANPWIAIDFSSNQHFGKEMCLDFE